jgi:glucose-1-phosphate adenylyltransferase
VISGARVEHSVISPSVFILDNALVKDSIIMDRVHIGKGARVVKAILDKGVTIPDGVDLDKHKGRFAVTDGGVVVVPKGTPPEVFLGR